MKMIKTRKSRPAGLQVGLDNHDQDNLSREQIIS